MKEQHRHSCGCAVCGRKKVNIEMELDQLYEQYYDELRSYAAEQRVAANGLRPPPNGAGPFPGSVEVDASGTVTQYDHRAPELHDHDPDDLDGEESEEYDDDDDYADDDELDDDDIGTDEADIGDEIDEPPPPPPITHRQQPRRPPVKAPPGQRVAMISYLLVLTLRRSKVSSVSLNSLEGAYAKFHLVFFLPLVPRRYTHHCG